MTFFKPFLLSTTAYANGMAEYQKSPSTQPLVDAVNYLNSETVDEDLTAYAPDIAMMVEYWDKIDTILEGEDAIRLAGKRYLPKFEDEGTSEYKNRLLMTKFTNIFQDIIEGLSSKPFEEEITLFKTEKDTQPPTEIEEFCENVDGGGNTLTVFAAQVFFAGIAAAIDWIFIDYPTVDTTKVRSRKDEKDAGIRPFWSRVVGRNVREVRTVIVNGSKVLSFIRIFEPNINGPDHVRIFQRNDAGKIEWSLFEEIIQQTNTAKKFKQIGGGLLTIDVIPLVPFITGRRNGSNWNIHPPMKAAADLQIQLYQDESALKFIKTASGYPMLAANGMRPEMEADGKTAKKLKTGPMRVLWGVPDGSGNHGQWAYVEPSAANMAFLKTDIDETKKDLRELGRQPLTAQSGNLTVITTAVAASKAKSAVAAWGFNLKDTLENALVITSKWISLNGYQPQVNVYNEYDDFTDGGEDLTELGAARRAGDLSQETYWSELKRRKVLAPEFDVETERDRLLNDIPSEADLDATDDKSSTKPVKTLAKPKVPAT